MRREVRHNKGFTLMELLVVMAISVILMGLVLAPVIETFRLTRRAQAMVESQDAARVALQNISREMGQAMYVYDNSSNPITISTAGVLSPPAQAETPIMLPVAQPSGGGTVWFPLPGGKIDFYLPKLMMHCNNPAHPADKSRDYTRNLDVTDAGGTRTELYDWPRCPYCGSDDVEARPRLPLEQDVTIVRYFLALKCNNLGAPMDPPNLLPINSGWVSPWGKNVIEGSQNQVILYRAEFNPFDDSLFPATMSIPDRLSDPYFFYRSGSATGGGTYAENWAKLARVVGIGKYEDLVTATTDPTTGSIVSVEPTITFRTESVENDTFNPAYVSDKMNDEPDAPPMIFSATYGYWTPDSRVDVFRGTYMDNPPGGADYYSTYQGSDLVVMRRVPAPGGGWIESVEFNISQYVTDGYVPPDSAGTQPREMAFTIDPNRGTVNFALKPPRPNKAKTGPVVEYSPVDINGRFRDDYAIDRGGAIRKRILPTFDDGVSDQYIANARIVPGSEKVIGPDMTFGPRFGQPVRYERVPLALGDPGINQYKIDYSTGWLFFSRDPSLDVPEKDHSGNDCSVQVYYLIYFNQKDDVVRGDYLTKSLINIHMGMRMFDPDEGKAYPVDLSDSVKIRNAIR